MTQITTVSPDKILQLGSAFWGSKTLLSAIELGLFTRLAASRPLGGPELRQTLGLHERAAHDFFDALVALGMLQRLADGRYANTPETELYLDRNKPTYCGGMLEMMNARLYRFWGNLTQALQTGAPQNEITTGEPDLFTAVYAEPARLEQFLRAMTGLSLPTARAISAVSPPCAQPMSAKVLNSLHGKAVAMARAVGRLRPVIAARNCSSRAGSR